MTLTERLIGIADQVIIEGGSDPVPVTFAGSGWFIAANAHWWVDGLKAFEMGGVRRARLA